MKKSNPHTVAGYKQVIQQGEYLLEEKKSKFLVRYRCVESRQDALDFVAYWREKFPDARHHCWAYCIGHPENPNSVAMSDDGEPSGTAGKPMLGALIGKGFGDVCVVVIRYFGGVKLGAGGLIRAYGNAVSKALDQSVFRRVLPKEHFVLICDFSQEQKVRHWVVQHGGHVDAVGYESQVRIYLILDLGLDAELRAFALSHSMKVEIIEQ